MVNEKIKQMHDYLLELQNNICKQLEAEDGQAKFHEDNWERPQGGYGKTRALENSVVIEKAGVNFSHVWGDQLPAAATINHPEIVGKKFHALGVSVIIHPRNPYAPTTHFNVRLFYAEKSATEAVWWFGGGFDLTPYYGFKEDCIYWHQIAKQACDPFGSHIYPEFKKAADDYFYLKHRQEARGIGGLFFDNYNNGDFNQSFALARSIGDHFMPAYIPILAKRKQLPYTDKERDFQAYRRGRYVEFNLIYDRGTLFGLQFGGRIESILISLPPTVVWRYDWQPISDSPEAELYTEFLPPRDWINER